MPSRAQLLTILRRHFRVVPERCTPAEIVIICPDCGDTRGNRGVSVASLKTNCWRCGNGGGLEAWARQRGVELAITEGRDDRGVEEILTAADAPQARSGAYVPEVLLPEGFVPLSVEPDCGYAELISRMAKRKRLTKEDLIRSGAGFTRDDPKWEPYAIFPVTEWGRNVYYQGRTYVDVPGESTKLFPNRKECPAGASNWVYGIDELRKKGGIAVVVEAILNVISLRAEIERLGIEGYIPVAVFKHRVSAPQLRKIASCPGIKGVVMAYDGEPDTIAMAAQDASRFRGLVPATHIEMPEGKDPNDDARLAMALVLGAGRRRKGPLVDLSVLSRA